MSDAGEPRASTPSDDAPPRWPPALLTSCLLGAAGAVLLLVGLVSGTTVLVVLATAAGSLSLGAALVWRSQLIRAWHNDRRRNQGVS